MNAVLIDITRLLYRRLAKRLPTGVDRVSLEYLRQYIDSARAVLSLFGLHIILPRPTSGRLFRLLCDHASPPRSADHRYCLP